MNKDKINENQIDKNAEEQFLSSYNMNDYERPSVAADIAVFSMFTEEDTESHRKDAEQKLHILLIKRGEHPFKGMWALPGGFLRSDETMEECALREIKEETNLLPAALLPIGTFSEPDRDPRGRILSNAFASIVNAEDVDVAGGSDAAGAEWFEVEFKFENVDILELRFATDKEELFAKLKITETKFGGNKFKIISNTGLAFDHAKIIAAAINAIRKEAENYLITFDFLPEKFTLATFQKVQETLMGISLLTANFRRKTADLVEETEDFTEGAGHRPARLYRRKETTYKMSNHSIDYLKQHINFTEDIKLKIENHAKKYNIKADVCAWYQNWDDFCSDWCEGLGYTKTEARKLLHGGNGEFMCLPNDHGIIRFAL